ILWSASSPLRWRGARAFEAAFLLLSFCLVGAIVFGGLAPSPVKNAPLEFLCLPLLIWAAFRFGQREVATGTAILAGIATWGTLHGLGPFARSAQNESLLLLQAFMAVTSVTTLALAAVVSERKDAERRLRRLAVSDSLTGLGNYRRLMAALAAEIGRSQRTGRPFAVLFFDLDDLKGINDRHGHLAGNQALRRVADALRVSCRSIDTAARFGGDAPACVAWLSDEGLAAFAHIHAAKAPPRPRVLSVPQYATVEALVEAIIPADERSPGAREARVADYVDLLLSEAEDAVKQEW